MWKQSDASILNSPINCIIFCFVIQNAWQLFRLKIIWKWSWWCFSYDTDFLSGNNKGQGEMPWGRTHSVRPEVVPTPTLRAMGGCLINARLTMREARREGWQAQGDPRGRQRRPAAPSRALCRCRGLAVRAAASEAGLRGGGGRRLPALPQRPGLGRGRAAAARPGRGGAMALCGAVALPRSGAVLGGRAAPLLGLLLLGRPAFSTTRVACGKNRRLRQKRAISERKLVSPEVNGVSWVASAAGLAALCVRDVRRAPPSCSSV